MTTKPSGGKTTMPRFIVRCDGSREYLPSEYRGDPSGFYAARMREGLLRARGSALESKRAHVLALEADLLMDLELAHIRAKIHDLGGRRRSEPRVQSSRRLRPRPICFAPRV